MPVQLLSLTNAEKRRLIKSSEYKRFFVTQFGCWSLYLSENQFHIGRAYAWLVTRHVDLHSFSDLRAEELLDLRDLLFLYGEALTTVLRKPDLVNCEWLGNEFDKHRGHGHMHFIPRYAELVTFQGEAFPDERFGKRSLYEKRAISETHMMLLRDALRGRFDYIQQK